LVEPSGQTKGGEDPPGGDTVIAFVGLELAQMPCRPLSEGCR
jgi:hypothetical protein